VEGDLYLTGSEEIIVIHSDRPRTQAIQHCLRGLVAEFNIRDGLQLIQEVNRLIKPLDEGILKMIAIGDGLIYHPQGLSLPDNLLLERLIIQKISQNAELLEQINDKIILTLYQCSAPQEEIVGKLRLDFPQGDLSLADILADTFRNYYSIPADVSMLTGKCVSLQVKDRDGKQGFSIVLEVQ
jgi:hypothetical protein